MKKKLVAVSFVSCFMMLFFIVGLSLAQDQSPKYGGTFKMACDSDIPTLDTMISLQDVSCHVTTGVFENLVQMRTADGSIAPELADSWTVSKDGLKITFKLRRGVFFHNGNEFTSKDALASMERWVKYGARSGSFRSSVVRVAAPDKYTLEMYLNKMYPPILELIGYPCGGPIMIPAIIAQEADKEPIKPEQCIGTGPYKFKKWVQGEYVEFERWEKYLPRKEEPNGKAGKKTAYIDKLQFHVVTETAARYNGVRSGQFHYGSFLPQDLYKEASKDPNFRVVKEEPPVFCQIFLNTKEGPCANLELRQAIQAALNMDEILQAGFGDLAVAQGSLFAPSTNWYTKAGLHKYNQKNPKLSKELAKKAGYKGEKIRMLVGSTWPYYDLSQVVAKQLEDAGFNIEFKVFDWAGVVANRKDPKLWDAFVTGSSGENLNPMLCYWLNPDYPGWWDTPEKRAAISAFLGTLDYKAQLDAWGKLQEAVYSQVPFIKFGDYHRLHMATSEKYIKGLGTATHPNQDHVYAYDLWLP